MKDTELIKTDSFLGRLRQLFKPTSKAKLPADSFPQPYDYGLSTLTPEQTQTLEYDLTTSGVLEGTFTTQENFRRLVQDVIDRFTLLVDRATNQHRSISPTWFYLVPEEEFGNVLCRYMEPDIIAGYKKSTAKKRRASYDDYYKTVLERNQGYSGVAVYGRNGVDPLLVLIQDQPFLGERRSLEQALNNINDRDEFERIVRTAFSTDTTTSAIEIGCTRFKIGHEIGHLYSIRETMDLPPEWNDILIEGGADFYSLACFGKVLGEPLLQIMIAEDIKYRDVEPRLPEFRGVLIEKFLMDRRRIKVWLKCCQRIGVNKMTQFFFNPSLNSDFFTNGEIRVINTAIEALKEENRRDSQYLAVRATYIDTEESFWNGTRFGKLLVDSFRKVMADPLFDLFESSK